MGLISKAKAFAKSAYDKARNLVSNVVQKVRGLSPVDKAALGVGAIVSPVVGVGIAAGSRIVKKALPAVETAIQRLTTPNRQGNVSPLQTTPKTQKVVQTPNAVWYALGAVALLAVL